MDTEIRIEWVRDDDATGCEGRPEEVVGGE